MKYQNNSKHGLDSASTLIVGSRSTPDMRGVLAGFPSQLAGCHHITVRFRGILDSSGACLASLQSNEQRSKHGK